MEKFINDCRAGFIGADITKNGMLDNLPAFATEAIKKILT